MALSPYLHCPGNCREMIAFYASVFGSAQSEILTYGEMPGDMSARVPDEMRELVAHAELVIHGTTVGVSDHFPPNAAVTGNIVGLILTYSDAATLRKEFAALSEGGTVEMPPAPTFWSSLYGVLTDRFGVPWQLMMEA